MTEVAVKAGGYPADEEFIFLKNYTCPVCGKEVKNPTVKSSKARLVGSDPDLRPVYEVIDTLKYDVVMCNHCGYAALERYFNSVTQIQKQHIQAKICPAYKAKEWSPTFSYEDAFFRYRMALANTIAKQAPDSERAYVALKSAWVLRSWRQSLGKEEAAKQEKLAKQEDDLLKNAKEGFQQANMKEDYPICGMDEATVDYLVAALSAHCGEYEGAVKLLSGIIANREVNARVK